MAKLKEMPEEHPEDRKARERAEAAAKGVIAAFVAEHQQELAALVQTYADAKAEALLRDLREKFWTEVPS